MQITSWSFDPIKFLFFIGTVLLWKGKIGFTPKRVAALLLLSQSELKFTARY